jgi:hypothetical protein
MNSMGTKGDMSHSIFNNDDIQKTSVSPDLGDVLAAYGQDSFQTIRGQVDPRPPKLHLTINN